MANNNKGIPVLNAPFSLEQEEALKRIQLAQMNANKLPTDMAKSVPNMPMQNTQTQAPVQNVQNKPFSNTQMQQMIADYNAKQSQQQSISMPTGNETVINDNNYRDLLSRADAIKRQQNQASQTREGAYAVNHPFLSTAMSFTGAPIVGVEGLVNNALGLTTGNVGNSRALEKTRNLREGAKANLGSAVTQGAYDIGTGIGDMLVNTTVANALGGGTALAGTLMGGNRANQVQRDAIDRGIGTRQASAFGTVAGAAEGYFNTKGLDAIKSGLTGNLLQKAIKGGAIEGAENILQTATEDIADALINRSDSEINTIKDNYIAQGMSETDANKQTVIDVLKQYGMDYATGFGFGTVMGAGRDALGELPRLLRNTDNTRVDADSDRVVADAIAKQNEAVDNINKLDEDLIDDAEIDAPNEPSNVNTNSAYDDADWDRLLNGASEQPDLRLLDKPNNVAENTGTNTPTTTVPMPEQEAVRTGRGNRNILGEELQPAYPKTEAEMKAETIQRAKDENSYVPLKDDIRAIATENNFKPNSEADAKAYNDFMAQAEKYIDDMENAKSDKDFVNAVGGLDALVRDAEGKIKGTTTYTESTGIEEARKQFADALIGHKVYLTQDVRDSKIPMREYNQAAYNAFGKSADGLKFVAKPAEGAVAFDQWLLENDNIKAIVGINADDGLSESLEKITNYLKSLKGKKNQTITEDYDIAKAIYDSDIWDKVSDITNKRDVAPELANKGYSKTFTNTGTRNDLVNMADEVHKRASMYDKSSNKESLDIAVKRVSEDAEGWEQRLLSGKENITDETSVDTIMLLAKDLKTQEAQARAEGNEIVARQLESRRIALMSKLREIGSKAGQKVQAFAKWNGTAEGLVLNAERLFDDNADNWGKTNKGKSDKIDKQSNFIANWWKTNFVEKAEGIVGFNEGADDDTLRQQIGDLLSSMGGDKIDPSNYEGTIDTFADMVREGMSGEQLAKRIKFYLANGITDISSETVRQVEDIFNEASQLPINSKQRVELEQEAIKLLAYSKKTNATFAQKFDDWRFLAMLSKPSTHIRNIIGNTMFREVTNVSDGIASILESGAQKAGLLENRTKAVLSVKDNGLVKASTTDADTNAARTLMGSKYSENIKGDIKRAQRVYNDDLIGRGLQKASDFNSNLLELEDYKAMRKKYSTALASYLKANGLNESVFNLEKEFNNNTRLLSNQEKAAVDTLAKAREYAIAQAEYSAFHEDNAVADILSQFSKQLNNSDSKGARILGKMFEGLLPFKKTPANIVRSAIEYSPINLLNDFAKAYGVSKGNNTANELIESMSKTITGTGIAALGAYLLDKGILISHDNETSNQDTLEGKQNYSIRLGDKTFTIDFLAPAVVPLLLGAEIKKVWDKNGNPNDSFWEHFRNATSDVDSAINSVFQMGSPILETTMLGGLNDTLQSISSAARNSENAGAELFSAGMNAATSYLQQGIPSSLGAITRTIDPIRRSTTTTATGEVTQTLDKQLQKLENKIPGLSRTNEPFIDSRGRTQNNSPSNNPLANLAYQLASPTYITNINETEADKIEREVYGATGNPDVFSKPEYSRKVGDSKLSPADLARYKAVKGQEKTKLEEAVGQSDFFKGLSPEDQRETLKTIDGLATKLGEKHVRPDETSMSTTNEKLVNAYEKDGAEGVVNALRDKHEKNEITDKLKENGLGDSDKLVDIFKEKGDQSIQVMTELKKVTGKTGGIAISKALPVIEKMSMSDADKGFYLANTTNLSGKAENFAKSGQYDNVWKYQRGKSIIDTNRNGDLTKKEIKEGLPVLERAGYSKQEAKMILGWF